ncbi:hypothetical protein [Ferrimonas marina]|uniref:Uncharacterized protein n=1 Tax=Ferrimonas marina TaxID=299255 RepID=A0A1M5YU60_9GAMM|nr:hypothetical protein [Ferrimonas marina]SHI15354.1 hypothetical protein SAMN02745129_4423 [Ferrimonas marina]
MVWWLLLMFPPADALIFEPGYRYACHGGPHQFEISVDSQGDKHISRYALVMEGRIAMPEIRYSEALQWQTLRLTGKPSALLRFIPEHYVLEVAVVDDQGNLLEAMEHPADCSVQ